MSKSKIMYSIVIPLFNEELVVNETYKRVRTVMDSTGEPYEIIFVNDGSRDGTLGKVREIAKMDRNICLISFSRNFGTNPP